MVFIFHLQQGHTSESVISHFDVPHVFLVVISLTAGAVLLMWIGELITQRGIGNGISLLIFASIVSRAARSCVSTWWNTPGPGVQGHDAVPRARGRSPASCS